MCGVVVYRVVYVGMVSGGGMVRSERKGGV